jgi:transposase
MENMMKKYIARLTQEEREYLAKFVKKGKGMAYKIKHANMLLQIDADGPAWTDEQTAAAFRCHVNTVRNVRQRFVEQGLEAALKRKKQQSPSREKILDGEGEARLESIACGKTPDGRAKWTLQLLADKLVELEIVESISTETVRRTLKKTSSSRTSASVG